MFASGDGPLLIGSTLHDEKGFAQHDARSGILQTTLPGCKAIPLDAGRVTTRSRLTEQHAHDKYHLARYRSVKVLKVYRLKSARNRQHTTTTPHDVRRYLKNLYEAACSHSEATNHHSISALKAYPPNDARRQRYKLLLSKDVIKFLNSGEQINFKHSVATS